MFLLFNVRFNSFSRFLTLVVILEEQKIEIGNKLILLPDGIFYCIRIEK